MKTRTWYEVSYGNGTVTKAYDTEKEAREEIEQARRGYPFTEFMTDENRKYWKGIGKSMVVVKVTQTSKILASN